MRFYFLPWMASTLLFASACTHTPQTYSIPTRDAFEVESQLLPWNTEEGQARLMTARQKADFFQLAHSHQAQIHPAYCGIATSVTVLNAFRARYGKDADPDHYEIQLETRNGKKAFVFPTYMQMTFFNEDTDKIKTREVVEFRNQGKPDPGLTLPQLAGMLGSYGLKAQLQHADAPPQSGVSAFRQTLIEYLAESEHFVVVNFKGKAMGATTGGHISPLAAYHAASDSVLILDVAGHKNPWYWAPIHKLYEAMHTKDGDNYRGWIIVSDPTHAS